MHEQAGCSFHGDAPIAGLTPCEADALMLGFLLKQEDRDRARSDDPEPVRQRKRELERGRERGREAMLRDAGFQ